MKANTTRCCCGDALWTHLVTCPTNDMLNGSLSWRPSKHTKVVPTDAFGTIEFQGGPHPIKAQYVRIAHDTRPDEILRLFSHEWRLEYPTLLMSIHGGKANFDMQPKLKKVIQRGLLKAAKTTGAWIFTGGIDCGVVKHVGGAFVNERSETLRGHVVTIGIAPWGLIEKREQLIGKDVTVPYHSISSPKSELAALNNRHAYFLLVDNGTIGKHGTEIALRRRLERHISKQKILTSYQSKASLQTITNGSSSHKSSTYSYASKSYGIPVVGVVIEGGANTIRYVLDYVTDTPPVPIVVCDGSGRAADIIAFVHKYVEDDGAISTELSSYLICTIQKTFDGISNTEAEQIYQELLECVKNKELITIFRMGETPYMELDHAILTALLKGSGLCPPDQLALSMAWNRVDVASSEIFVYGRDWTSDQLEHAMMEALSRNLVGFVKLLLENGVNMQRFLTIPRLEELYNTKMGPAHTLKYLVRDIQKHTSSSQQYTLQDIGLVIEKLMGGAYTSRYRQRDFRALYEAVMKQEEYRQLGTSNGNKGGHFYCPYNEVLIWAVLMKRQQMALFMWQRGEEPIAKALVAIRLYKSMAHEASEDDLEADISDYLREYSREFERLAIELLDYSYRQDAMRSQQMLTYELQNWSKQTCLTLAVTANHREFLAHPCCQILLADLWMGGLRMRKSTYLKVILALLFPPLILFLDFKSKQELQMRPQTEEEHILEKKEECSEDSMSEYDIGSVRDIENGRVMDSPHLSNSQASLKYNEVYNEHRRHHQDNLAHFHQRNHLSIKRTRKPIKFTRKIYEFYTAPVTKFFGHTITYFLFLFFFTYSVLVRMTPTASLAELFSLFYIVTLSCEKIREIASLEPMRFKQTVSVWFDNNWNFGDVTFIILFLSAFLTRLWPDHLETSRIMYGVDIIYWYIRILHFLSVNKSLGPYVTMMGKMIIDMLYFVVLLLVVLMSFGVARQGILNPYEDPSWDLVKEIFFQPYFMLYGEVFADQIDPPCGEGPDLTPCRKGRWVTIVVMAIFLLVANILLINLLIAVFNNTFLSVTAVSHQVWKSKRYSLVMEYEQKPLLPPPLILLNHVHLATKYIKHRFNQQGPRHCYVLKLFLSQKDLETINNFEEECVEGYFRENELKLKSHTDAVVKMNHERVEQMVQKLDDMSHSDKYISAMQQELNCHVMELHSAFDYVSNSLAVIHRFMAMQRPSIGGDGDSTGGGDQLEVDQVRDSDNDTIDDAECNTHNDKLPMVNDTCTEDQDELNDAPFALEMPHSRPLTISSMMGNDGNRMLNSRRRASVAFTSDVFATSSKSEFEGLSTYSNLYRRNSNQSKLGISPSFRRSLRHKQDFPIQRPSPLLEYTSITDEIESAGLQFHQHASPTHSVINTPQMRQHSEVGKGLTETERAILEKERKLLNAERVDYQRMDSLVCRRLSRHSENDMRAFTNFAKRNISIEATISTDPMDITADSDVETNVDAGTTTQEETQT